MLRQPICRCLKTRPFRLKATIKFASTATDSSVIPSTSNDVTTKDATLEPENLPKMSRYHKMLMSGKMIPPDLFKWQQEVWAKQQRFAKYGQRSGVDPKLLWPTKEELEDLKAERDELAPSFKQLYTEMRAKQADREAAYKARVKEVDTNLKQYHKVLGEYKAKLQLKQKEVDLAEEKKRKKIQEIQEYFGYSVDTNDPRFKAMMDKKEQEELKAEKLAKRMERRAKQIVSAAQPTAESESTAA